MRTTASGGSARRDAISAIAILLGTCRTVRVYAARNRESVSITHRRLKERQLRGRNRAGGGGQSFLYSRGGGKSCGKKDRGFFPRLTIRSRVLGPADRKFGSLDRFPASPSIYARKQPSARLLRFVPRSSSDFELDTLRNSERTVLRNLRTEDSLRKNSFLAATRGARRE